MNQYNNVNTDITTSNTSNRVLFIIILKLVMVMRHLPFPSLERPDRNVDREQNLRILLLIKTEGGITIHKKN